MRPETSPRVRELLIWALAFAVLGASAAAIAAHIWGLGALVAPHLHWWELALGFAVAERAVVHLHFRRSAHSFTLGDIPMALGLIFASPPELIIGALSGSVVMWVVDRRMPPIKLVFNVAQLTAAICVAELIIHTQRAGSTTVGPELWLFTLFAIVAGALVTVALISAAIALSEGALPKGMLEQMFGLDLAFTVANTALALVAAVIIREEAIALPLILVPAAITYFAYRAYIVQHQRSERLEFLYDATRSLSHSSDVVLALSDLLARCRDTFRVELAEIVLLSADENVPIRISDPPAGAERTMVALEAAVGRSLKELVSGESGALVLGRGTGHGELDDYLRDRGIREGVLARLPGDGRVAGTMLLANRVGVERKFDSDDLRLLETLGVNTGAVLQFDRLEQAVWQLRELQEQLVHQASHDELTDLPSRTLFVSRVKQTLDRDTGSAAVLFVDLDDFKRVNESLGHSAGDELLTVTAARLRECVLPADLVARLGGDEFGILLRDPDEPVQAGAAVANRILRVLAAPVSIGERRAAVSASIGIATGRAGYEDAEELMGNADIAMYESKQTGKRRSTTFSPRLRSAALERHSLRDDLERARERDQLRVDYQPILSLSGHQVVGAEALIRWQRQYGRLMTASEFVPMVQDSELILTLGEFVLADACSQGRGWLGAGAFEQHIAVHVNLSAAELDDAHLAMRLASALERSGLPGELLVLEVSEGAVLRDPDAASARMAELRSLGVRFALDGFGSGYSSLSYLRAMPLSFLKIARPFIESITAGPREAAFVRTVRELAATIDVQVVATAIETRDQLELLTSLGCDLGQGYLLGRPGPPAVIPLAGHAAGSPVADPARGASGD